jgi:hypothetical protein
MSPVCFVTEVLSTLKGQLLAVARGDTSNRDRALPSRAGNYQSYGDGGRTRCMRRGQITGGFRAVTSIKQPESRKESPMQTVETHIWKSARLTIERAESDTDCTVFRLFGHSRREIFTTPCLLTPIATSSNRRPAILCWRNKSSTSQRLPTWIRSASAC